MKNILIEASNSIALVTINRPEALNALNQETLEELLAFLEESSSQQKLKVIILTGSGNKAFIAGADIKAMHAMQEMQMLQFSQLGQRVANALENGPFVTIAAVNGYALGGGLEMALACDFIYASDNAVLGLPEVKLGIIPGFGGTQRLTNAVGMRRAKEMIFRGQRISAQEAREIGLVNQVFPLDELLEQSQKTAIEITKHSFTAILHAKQAIMHASMELESSLCALCFSTPERQAAMEAFLSKSKT